MSISLEGQKCPVCHGYMFDDDDIVYCPTCGAPSHRDCYNSIGHCPLEEFHGTDKQYKPNTEKEKEPINETAQDNNNSDNFYNKNYNGAVPPFGLNPFVNIDQYGGVDENAEIDNVTAKELKNSVAVNTNYYIPKFFMLNKKKKLSWNWAAFLVPHAWFFYRKNYKAGFLAITLTVCANVLMNFILTFLPANANVTYNEIISAIMASPERQALIFLTAFLGLALSLIYRIVFGLYGNWIYRQEKLEQIKKIKEEQTGNFNETIKIKGGINPLLGVIALMSVNWLVSLIYLFI